MISFKSIFARIIFLHVIAMVITAMFMPLVLYWFLKSAANDLHQQAMRDQADLVALHLAAGESGQLTLDLPPALRDLYSQAYGRYAYAVVDDSGRVLFSSLSDNAAIFPHDLRSSEVAYLETPPGQGGNFRRQHPQTGGRSHGMDRGRGGSRPSRRHHR